MPLNRASRDRRQRPVIYLRLHAFKIRCHSGRIHHRFWADALDHCMARMRQGCIVVPHYGLGKGNQEIAVLDTTAGGRRMVGQG
jgi:hypothetical protein